MVCTNPCDDCKREGLPILFTRYAVGYSSRSEGLTLLDKFKPTGKLQAQPGGVSIKTGRYGVRMLRAGYLYLRIERRGLLEWEGYAIHPHGYLKQFPVMLPQQAEVKIACARDARQANNSLVWIKDAKNVKSLWYAFHPDPIDPAHLKREIEPNPAKYMQQFDVAGWLGGNTSQADSMQPAQLDKQVLEYAALGDEKVQVVGNEQFFGLMGMTPQERGWGNYEKTVTEQQVIPTPDAAPVIIEDTRIETVTQPPYKAKHGSRLEGMRKFLQDNKGAVVACEDALGVAQELSLHHLSASVPYVKWLKTEDGRNITNAWKDSASRSIQTVKKALEKKAIDDFDGAIDRMREVRENMGGHYPGSDSPQPVRVRRPDGTYETISIQELNRRRREDLQKQIEQKTAKRQEAVDDAAKKAQASIDANCDMALVSAFDTEHEKEIRNRDTEMDRVAEDLVQWLKSDSLTDKALGLYSDTASADTGDGDRCAGQLCVILMQLDNSPRGRAWYGSLDLFTPHKKNLVWRMLSLNNRALSSELQSALQLLVTPIPPSEQAVTGAQDNARSQKAYADMAAALNKMSGTLKTSDKVEKDLLTVLDGAAAAADRRTSLMKLAKEAKNGMAGIVLSAVMIQVKGLSPSEMEKRIARTQALLLARGLGTKAIAHIKQLEQDALSSALMKQVKSIDRRIRNAIKGGSANSAMQEMRTTHAICAVNALAILPAISRAYVRHDLRTTTELVGSMADLLGMFKDTRATFYEKVLYKQVPDIVYKTHKVGTATVAERELLTLKAGAARYVAAGAVVGVIWDSVDGVTAYKEKEKYLMVAYAVRAVSGSVAVGGAILSARYLTAPLWLLRLNLVSGLLTVAATFVIGKLKGVEWENWLKAQPFHKASSTKIPYKSEAQMMDKLADALADIG
ncbi:T6SS effector BTH_I2691 family protein [Ralstonia flatus]|uniref:Toxin VasX N-terminal region domain-containing protein n=1 Tax=Ralstonia flatus TaxID=3058601 RepID=A0AAD2C1C8_9RALS|nr:T6SS effector BTH_I2691 family protein [Ralstonia sp. LMG 32965]MBN6209925.1 hypothetical protein [Ralstonia pickettii]CAJ0892817.1 hypothetical protein R77567_04390 [Ralstonia sp. LMG 32965]CAJ0902690.1 hypothetical protein R77564_04777 [Ralstonia sp. LMG 32965]